MSKANLPYRKCVAIALFNDNGMVFVAERSDKIGSWQMPQGGIDSGETIEQAGLRELKEEIGTSNIEILEITKKPLKYEFPDNINNRFLSNYKGQEQYWIAAKFKGSELEINLNNHEIIEFSKWKWVDIHTIPNLIVPFKKKVYQEVVNLFSKYSTKNI